ncbi:MAG: hypothetical protein Q8Q86_01805 [Candidatus Daviesbacteria bacterium]|nr:hypothetical protein [Candidatus Daviesbacteria bacterium]
MSPSVERSELNGNLGQIPVITVSLKDSEVFDPVKFDGLVESSMGFEYGMYPLKYIVYADTMYLFPARFRHVDVNSLLRSNGVAGVPQSAGSVGIILDESEGSFRTISDSSDSLSIARIFSRSDSNNYQSKVIKEVLGDFFTIMIR